MKKHAFLIGAYKNPDYLLELIDSLDSERSNFYIHVNKYNDSTFSDFKNKIVNRKNIHYYSSIKIRWGGSDLFKSQMLLCIEALKDNNDYFHFLTGQDILCRPLNEFFDYVENNDACIISFSLLSNEEYDYRYSYFNLYDILNVRSGAYLKKLNSLLVKIQDVLHLKRKRIIFQNIYWGSAWWSLKRNACQYLVDKWNNNHTLCKRIEYTFAPDEMLVQTLLLNANSNFSIVNDNLHYMKWTGKPSPSTLTLQDYDEIKKSGKFFARKIDPILSSSLIERMKK